MLIVHVHVKVTVAGRRVPVSGNANWKAVITIQELLKRIDPGSETVCVTVLAKDKGGKTGAAVQEVRLPNLNEYIAGL